MDKIKELILQIESLKADQKFNDAIKIVEKALITYNWDYRLYEELADIYLYKGELEKWLKSINFALNSPELTGNVLLLIVAPFCLNLCFQVILQFLILYFNE